MSEEIYPMPMFPTLAVRDPAASAAWYREALGFAHVFTLPGPGGAPLLVHLRRGRYADLLLRPDPVPAPGPRGAGVTLTFAVQRADEVDALAESARRSGTAVLQEPGVRPWNVRDVSLADPDGFHLTFTFGPVDAGLSIDQVADRARRAAPSQET